MPVQTVLELPEFDTGEYRGCEFCMSEGDARLTVHTLVRQPFSICFKRVRWHQFTALYNCSAEMIEGSYFVLSEIDPSPALQAYMRADSATAKAYQELHHFRILLEETGCHEVFAQSASADALAAGEPSVGADAARGST